MLFACVRTRIFTFVQSNRVSYQPLYLVSGLFDLHNLCAKRPQSFPLLWSLPCCGLIPQWCDAVIGLSRLIFMLVIFAMIAKSIIAKAINKAVNLRWRCGGGDSHTRPPPIYAGWSWF